MSAKPGAKKSPGVTRRRIRELEIELAFLKDECAVVARELRQAKDPG